ncbi:phosphatase, carbohydrate metabolism [Yamadazyma tenuis]|uniref:Phosphoglycerate mutase-like protein n=1 Tax=Candida tenuis (strain ATCC 10573 / BCRC 21748 / CBS 615 / JCM 9827 / NBRC 10315 / NRRL Y-1498 / VKM Y-70) TaxID=590646 RepID=G3AZ55_CANTC|nr:phosphoglycerate mutase-like protein [Yamadazyma tenuis ATCC 10573]XP_006684854.1 uncharacterized protein CANTEDRAFT_112877 [Yamadazyma tenuis ATCC 10573]EGV66279.1 phosphoglycerate mutase-like protein [Yamadazyma tenuis ATCC 10573]EGV66280.1 hypothetical protein CANTEDRAFT_112877 [Yamadazyma tenuis ATCC 10573]WEJ95649.1 phosphatase, carbohydrate metabolism [Yamadazyma tenuis]
MTVSIEPNTDDKVLRIFFIRHGQTDHNLKKILQGHVDVDINATGEDQADKVGQMLKIVKFDHFVSSDLIRCIKTTKEIIKYQDLDDFRTTYNLREREMGKVQGMYIKDALAQYGDGFRNMGETSEKLLERVNKEFDTILKEAIIRGNKNVGVCTHGGVLIQFFNHLYKDKHYKMNTKLLPEDLRVPFNTSVSVIDLDKATGEGLIQAFGDTTHLGADLKVNNQLLR